MTARRTNPLLVALGILGAIVLTVISLIWATLDLLLFPLFEPLVVVLSQRRFFQRMGLWLMALSPGTVLTLFALPFLAVQVTRLIALYWMATGAVVPGFVLMIGAYVLSLFTVDRIYHTGRLQMHKVRWFAPVLRRIEARREGAKAWVRASLPWRMAARVLQTLVSSATR